MISENVKINLKLSMILLMSAFSFVWSKKAVKFAKISGIHDKLNLEHNFHRNMIVMMGHIK